MRRIALAIGSGKVMVNAQAQQAVYCREQRFTVAGWHPSPRSYSGNQTVPRDLAEREMQFDDFVDVRSMLAQHMTPEAHFAFTENFPEALQTGLAGFQCTGMLRCTVFQELIHTPFPQSSKSKPDLTKDLLRPQSTLILSSGAANLGVHNFSKEIGPSTAIEAGAQATRLLGHNLRCIQLPMETMST
jgi:hypothetical protein